MRQLGAGDFAQVHLVEAADGRRGAMKIATQNNSSAHERLRFELDALERLDHPSIPKVLDKGNSDTGQPWFVMSLAPGRSLLDIDEDWGRSGRVHGAREALVYLTQLLDAVHHMRSTCGLVHRDIKDANVIIDHTRELATLIDFGFCKPEGQGDIRDKDSFWRAGAARFAPPQKLEDPALAVPSHDVFALGVIGYRLCTGLFPWSVSPQDGFARYRKHLRDSPLVLPHEINTLIPVELSRLMGRMLELNDAERVTADKALSEAHSLLATMRLISSPRGASTQRYPHVVRDPIRGDIRLTDLEYQVLNCAEMQRLRWVRQLGLTNLVYPGADHSRLLHSIGTLERVEFLMRTIEMHEGVRLDAELRSEARLYALTHDVSHIAFGHTIEDQLGLLQRHDANAPRYERLVASEKSDLRKLLIASGDIGRSVMSRLNPSVPVVEDAVEHLVSGVTGGDVLDYIDRDAYFCGLDHRVDSAMARQLRVYARDQRESSKLFSTVYGKYGIRHDREFAVEQLLLERFALFMKVYTHTTKVAADAVLNKALSDAVMKRKAGYRESELEQLGDEGLLYRLATDRSPSVKEMGWRLRNRKLPRPILRAPVIESEEPDLSRYGDAREWLRARELDTSAGRVHCERDIARKSGHDAASIFLYIAPQAPGYRIVETWTQSAAGRRPGRSTAHLEIARRHLRLWDMWVFTTQESETVRQEIAIAAEDILQRANQVDEFRSRLL